MCMCSIDGAGFQSSKVVVRMKSDSNQNTLPDGV